MKKNQKSVKNSPQYTASTNDLIKINATADSQQSLAQKKVNQLWEQIQTQKQQLADYDKQIGESLTLYQTLIMPAEKHYLLAPQIALAERLMTLFERKSLTDWQRDIMVSWMSRVQEQVEVLDAEQGQQLQHNMFQLMQKVARYSMSDTEQNLVQQEMQAEFARLAEELFGETIPAPDGGWDMASFTAMVQQRQAEQPMEQFDGNAYDTDAADDSNFQENFFQTAKKPVAQKNSDAFETWINQMFRRTARVLHPDKQPDEKLRKQYAALMARLSHAKDKQDIATIIELYMTHVSDKLDDMETLDEKHLVTALQSQLASLKDEMHLQQHKNPLTPYAMKRLKKAAVDSKEQQKWLKEIKAEAHACMMTVKNLKNLTTLKAVLADMWEEQREEDRQIQVAMFGYMFDEEFDFDD